MKKLIFLLACMLGTIGLLGQSTSLTVNGFSFENPMDSLEINYDALVSGSDAAMVYAHVGEMFFSDTVQFTGFVQNQLLYVSGDFLPETLYTATIVVESSSDSSEETFTFTTPVGYETNPTVSVNYVPNNEIASSTEWDIVIPVICDGGFNYDVAVEIDLDCDGLPDVTDSEVGLQGPMEIDFPFTLPLQYSDACYKARIWSFDQDGDLLAFEVESYDGLHLGALPPDIDEPEDLSYTTQSLDGHVPVVTWDIESTISVYLIRDGEQILLSEYLLEGLFDGLYEFSIDEIDLGNADIESLQDDDVIKWEIVNTTNIPKSYVVTLSFDPPTCETLDLIVDEDAETLIVAGTFDEGSGGSIWVYVETVGPGDYMELDSMLVENTGFDISYPLTGSGLYEVTTLLQNDVGSCQMSESIEVVIEMLPVPVCESYQISQGDLLMAITSEFDLLGYPGAITCEIPGVLNETVSLMATDSMQVFEFNTPPPGDYDVVITIEITDGEDTESCIQEISFSVAEDTSPVCQDFIVSVHPCTYEATITAFFDMGGQIGTLCYTLIYPDNTLIQYSEPVSGLGTTFERQLFAGDFLFTSIFIENEFGQICEFADVSVSVVELLNPEIAVMVDDVGHDFVQFTVLVNPNGNPGGELSVSVESFFDTTLVDIVEYETFQFTVDGLIPSLLYGIETSFNTEGCNGAGVLVDFFTDPAPQNPSFEGVFTSGDIIQNIWTCYVQGVNPGGYDDVQLIWLHRAPGQMTPVELTTDVVTSFQGVITYMLDVSDTDTWIPGTHYFGARLRWDNGTQSMDAFSEAELVIPTPLGIEENAQEDIPRDWLIFSAASGQLLGTCKDLQASQLSFWMAQSNIAPQMLIFNDGMGNSVQMRKIF